MQKVSVAYVVVRWPSDSVEEVRVLPDINDNSTRNDDGGVGNNGNNITEYNAFSILLSNEFCECGDNVSDNGGGLHWITINNSICRGDSDIILIRSNDD